MRDSSREDSVEHGERCLQDGEMDLPTNDPAIRLSELGGVNERASRDQIPPGQWEILEGMYPARSGMLERIPGRTLLSSFGSRILAIHPTNDGTGNILLHTEDGLQSTNIDVLLNRTYTPDLSLTPVPEEDDMSMALIVQREANGVNGGSPRGYLTGTDSGIASNTFYGRRLTHLLINENDSLGVPTVNTFTASTGGTAAVSTEGTFVLVPGTYRIKAELLYNSTSTTERWVGAVAGLYNTTAARFEYHRTTGGSGTEPIISTVFSSNVNQGVNTAVHIGETSIYIAPADGNQTYAIRHALIMSTGTLPDLYAFNTFCGRFPSSLTASVNGSAAQMQYAAISIKRVA